jgi:adenylate cyclase
MTLRALALKHQFRPDATREARGLLTRALEQDPQYAPAWMMLSFVNSIDSLQRLTGEWHPGRYDEMVAQARRAVELDPQLPWAHLALSVAHFAGRRFGEARVAALRCAELGPNDAECQMFLAMVEVRLGLGAEAVEHIGRALDLSPIPPAYTLASLASVMWSVGRLEEALAAADDCLAKAPRHLGCRRFRMLALVELGRMDEARTEAAMVRAQFPSSSLESFKDLYADEATVLRARVVAAATAAGIPAADAALARR